MIASPDLSVSRSRLADWLELLALFSPHGAGEANLASVARLNSDEHRDRETDAAGEIVEDEILDSDIEEAQSRTADEIGDRLKNLGDEYPFIVRTSPLHISLKADADLSVPHWVYLFLLLLSAEHDKALPKSAKIDGLIRKGRTLFHICASVGVAGLLRNGKTFWFGFPRPDGTPFLLALAKVCTELGFGKAKEQVPAGYPIQAKDDSIDVIGWRKFRDVRNGGVMVLCQAATGATWDDKSVMNHIQAFKGWFEVSPYSIATGSIAIPFPAYHEVQEHVEDGFQVAVHNFLDRQQSRHGVLLDRFRIVESAFDLSADAAAEASVGGFEKLPELQAWVGEALAAIMEVA